MITPAVAAQTCVAVLALCEIFDSCRIRHRGQSTGAGSRCNAYRGNAAWKAVLPSAWTEGCGGACGVEDRNDGLAGFVDVWLVEDMGLGSIGRG